MSFDVDKALLWKAGRLAWKLDRSQLEAYKAYRKWEADTLQARKDGVVLEGLYPRVYVFDAARRTGKDFLCLLIRIEDAIRFPGSIYSFGTAFAKDVSEILVGLFEKITEDCPPHLRPSYKAAWQGNAAALVFPNKSLIRLIGCDRGSDNLRGRFSNGICISESGFVENLKEVIVSILMPQLQGDQKATILLNSTPPVTPGHPYDDIFVPDAQTRGAYMMRTIDDNPRLSDAEKEEFIAAAGGRESETCRREYFVERIRSPTRVVVPEFDRKRHVQDNPVPKYAHGFVSIDPGVEDLCAILFAYFDFERAKLVIRHDWAERNASTGRVAAELKRIEKMFFGSLKYYDGKTFCDNPVRRISDTDKRIITDLSVEHGLKVLTADKTDAMAALHSFRNAFAQDKIEVHPDAKHTIAHLENAVWNAGRTSYARSDIYGHYDAVDAGKYLWRSVSKELMRSPFPPHGVVLQSQLSRDTLFLHEHELKPRKRLSGILDKVFTSRYKRR